MKLYLLLFIIFQIWPSFFQFPPDVRQKFACKVEDCDVPSVHSPQITQNRLNLSPDEIRINHYYSAFGRNRSTEFFTKFDDSANRFVPQLEEKLDYRINT